MATPLGNDDQTTIVEVSHGIDGVSTGSLEVAVVDPKGTNVATNSARVNTDNIIGVEMGGRSEKDWEKVERKLQRELEEVMVERKRKKLACFQKTRRCVIKKGDTTKASVPVNSPFTLEELVHMIDVSVNSTYEADLEGITRTLTDSIWGSVDLLSKNSSKSVKICLGRSGLPFSRF
jgi:hypothetical protein